MNDHAGIFQVQEVLGKKIETSGLKGFIEISAVVSGREVKVTF
jgi:metal-dependent HD superfamily phosphatase/phosphodiesterase